MLRDAARDTSLRYSCVDQTRECADFYEGVYRTARSGSELVERIRARYPDVKGDDFAIEWPARLLFPESAPGWFCPLPGPPGEIFLNPSGVYDGDPACE